MQAKPSSVIGCEPTPANWVNEFDIFCVDPSSRVLRSSRTIEFSDSYIAAVNQLSPKKLPLVPLPSEKDGRTPAMILSLVSLLGGCNWGGIGLSLQLVPSYILSWKEFDVFT